MLNSFQPNKSQKRSADESSSHDPRVVKKSKKNVLNYDLLSLGESIKQAAINGDVDVLRSHFENDSALVDFKCDGEYSALYYAAKNEKYEVVKYLLEKGASIQINEQLNIFQELKEPKCKQMRKYIKDERGFDKSTLAVLSQEFKMILEKEFLKAKALNKNLLVILGEYHGNFKNYQIEKQVLKLLNKLGVNVLYNELPSGREREFKNQSRDFCIEKLSMENISVDNHLLRDYGATIEERNEVIALEILKRNEHGVLITGALHMQGLLENDLYKPFFHIVPFNLLYSDVSSSLPNEFLMNCENVINVFENGLTLSEPVINRWNINMSVSVSDKSWLDITSVLDNVLDTNYLATLFAPNYTMFTSLIDCLTTQPLLPAPAEGKPHLS